MLQVQSTEHSQGNSDFVEWEFNGRSTWNRKCLVPSAGSKLEAREIIAPKSVTGSWLMFTFTSFITLDPLALTRSIILTGPFWLGITLQPFQWIPKSWDDAILSLHYVSLCTCCYVERLGPYFKSRQPLVPHHFGLTYTSHASSFLCFHCMSLIQPPSVF